VNFLFAGVAQRAGDACGDKAATAGIQAGTYPHGIRRVVL